MLNVPGTISFLPTLGVFVAPAFAIAGLLAIAIPVLIHILNRRRFKVVNWAAMEFLMQALRKNRRRLRFEQLILLITRCALVGLLGVALARPMGCDQSRVASLAAQRNAMHVIVIDNSYSMAYQLDRGDAHTHLDQAKKLARQIISRLSPGGESVAIVTAGYPAAAVIARAGFDLQASSAAIDRIEQGYAQTDISGAIALASQIAREDSRPVQRVLHLITDGTRSAFEIPQRDALANAAREAAKLFRVSHYSLGAASQANGAIIDLHPSAQVVTTQFGSDMLATARGYGLSAPATLQWKLDDQLIGAASSVQLDPQTHPIVQTQANLKSGGAHVLSVSLGSDDRLPIDNVRNRVVDVASQLKVLIVEGERGAGPMGSSGAFLSIALAPQKDGVGKTDSYLVPELISDLELGSRPLGDYRAVILCGVGQVQSAIADQLQRFVQQGGTLITFMGEAVNATNYNQVLLPRRLLPGALIKRMSASADTTFNFDFNPNGAIHPLLAIFRGEENSGLGTANVYTYWQVDPNPAFNVEHVVDYIAPPQAQKDPAITVHSLGDGRVVFFSTSAGGDWAPFTSKPIYVELIHELLTGSINGDDRWMNLVVGQSLILPPSLKLTSAPTLSDVAGNPQPLNAVAQGGQMVYRSGPLNRPGVFTLNTGQNRLPIAVNVPSDEADVRTLTGDQIKKALGDIELTLNGDQIPAESASADLGRDYGWGVMLVVLVLLGLECVLAMRFGHYAR